MIGLVAAGETLPANAAPYLISMQNSNGGWGYSPSFGGTDTDSTGLALQALAAAGSITDSTLTATGAANDALDYLRATQNSDGGWGYSSSYPATSATSTAYAIQGLTAAGENPSSSAWSMVSSSGDGTSQLTVHTPFEALHRLQSSEGGFQGFSGTNDPMATYQALPGLNEVAFPIQQQQAVSVQSVFTASPLQGTAPLAVTFSNSSTGDYTTSLWTFGDGGQSWLTAPTHTYTQTGVFTATLTVSGPGGTATESAAITVQAAPAALGPVYLPLVQRSAVQ
jgi:PKD repeat protein